MIDADRKDDIPRHGELPVLYIIESKSGAWATSHVGIADKYRNKPGSIVTDYYSKVAAKL